MKKAIREGTRMMAGIAIVSTVLLLGIFQGLAQQTAGVLETQLLGTWTLVSWESLTKDGIKEPTMEGINLKGLLIFDGKRYSLQIISEIPKLASKDRMKTTAEENKAVAHGVLSIFGTYSVNETDKVLMLQVERSSFPNQTGENLKRVITSLTADELIYTTPKRLAGGSNTFVWKRAK